MQGTHFVGFLLLALGVGKSDAFRVLAWSRRPQVRAAPNIVMCATGSNSSDIVQKLNEIASMAAPDADLKERDLALIERERAAAAQKKSDAEALERSLAESVDDAEAFGAATFSWPTLRARRRRSLRKATCRAPWKHSMSC